MNTGTLNEAKALKVRAEIERGWGGRRIYTFPVDLEPPFVPFQYGRPNRIDLAMLGMDGMSERGSSGRPSHVGGTGQHLQGTFPSRHTPPMEQQHILHLYPSKDDEMTPSLAEQFILSLNGMRFPVSFEVYSTGRNTVCQMVAAVSDVSQVRNQLSVHYPQLQIELAENDRFGHNVLISNGLIITMYVLQRTHFVPIRVFANLKADPLGALIGALETPLSGQFGGIQVMFVPCRCDWQENMRRACRDEYDGRRVAVRDQPDLIRQAEEKIDRPLFAVAVNIVAQTQALSRQLQGFLALFSTPNNAFGVLNSPASRSLLVDMVTKRINFHYGMLLNSAELAGLVHLPSASIHSDRLKRATARTAPAPEAIAGTGLVLGENTHRGRTAVVTTNRDQRRRHMYMIGASGTGKSTLLLNMIDQDVRNGEGLAILDPHGDLVEKLVLPRIPGRRWQDVVYFDPGDDEYPIGFNVLSAHTEHERELLCDDLISIFKRLSPGWGPRLDTIMANGILSIICSRQGGTLLDLRRFLVDDHCREEYLATLSDPEILYFWRNEFPLIPRSALSPVLTRLNTFLRRKTIRNIVCQRENKINFREIMDSGKIFLCKLAHGGIGEENAYLLGSFICSRLQQQVMTRQDIAEERRRDFYLYIDEFQNFVTKSMETILSGARKYRLGLILAHQNLQQTIGKNKDVAEAVLANPYVRVCFRLGDDDARRLQQGFRGFDMEDLMNLSRGEAIVRFDRSDWSFNMKTFPPPAMPPESQVQETITQIIRLSREKYGTPRERVEAQLERYSRERNLPRDSDDFYS